MIIAAQFLGHLKHSWNLNWPFDLWLGFWLGLPFDLSGLWLQEFQVVPEKMHLKIMQLQFHQLHFIQYVKLQQNQSVVQSKEKSSKCLRYCASISVTVHLSDDKSHMKFVSKSKCPYPASLWSLRSRGTWSTWNTGVTLKINIDTWSEHQTGVSKQENRHDQSDMEYYSSNECVRSCNLRRVPVSRRLLDHPLDQIHKIHLQDLPTKKVEHTELHCTHW